MNLNVIGDLLVCLDQILSVQRSFVMRDKNILLNDSDFTRDAIDLSELIITINIGIKNLTKQQSGLPQSSPEYLKSELEYLINNYKICDKYKLIDPIKRMIQILNH